MRIQQIRIHNFRSITDTTIEAQGYLMLVGANNSGKSNVINALRAFYDDLKWSNDDFPKVGAKDNDSWIELIFELSGEEWAGIDHTGNPCSSGVYFYKLRTNSRTLVRKMLMLK